MEITSHHLEQASINDEFTLPDSNEAGEEQAKRGPYFGHPVGKRESCTVSEVVVNRRNFYLCLDEGAPPILICKIRKGQELKARCYVIKVSA